MQLHADVIIVGAVAGYGDGTRMARLDNPLYGQRTPRARQVA